MKILVLGAAISGKAAAALARSEGHEVAVYDRDSLALAPLREDGFTVHGGAWARHHLADVDLVVTSPGIPPHAEPLVDTRAAGIPVVSEIEFAVDHLPGVAMAAVTGTNGKTTTTALIAEMLTASGIKAAAVGNIGSPLSAAVDEAWDALAVEVSSFQLHHTQAFHPRVAVVLNVAPDHLDWHGSFEAYAAAKARIFRNLQDGDLLLYDRDDAGARALVETAPIPATPVSGTHVPPGGHGVDGTGLVVGGVTMPAPSVGPAFLVDIAAAAAAALHLGADPDAVASVAGGFHPGAHRRRVLAEIHGVRWVDDSKATNPHAAVASASSFDSVILIAGGRNKGLDLAPLVEVPTLRHVLAIGEAVAELVATGDPKVEAVGDLAAAVARAATLAEPGDTVLLAPGCASFDQFASYAARGEAFAGLVAGLVAGATDTGEEQ